MQLDSNKKYILCLSGGRDSVALFNMMVETGLDFMCVHVNHGLSQHAETWERFCERLCTNNKIKLVHKRVFVSKTSPSVESEARNKRYEAIKSEYRGYDAIVTAHHRDDNIETILFNILRGGEFAAMDGMDVESEVFGMTIVRPLITMTRKEIDSYLYRNGINEFVEDESNSSSDYTRNFLRNEILPALRSKMNGVDTAIEAFAGKAKIADQYRNESVESRYPTGEQIHFWKTREDYLSGSIGRDRVITMVTQRLKKHQNKFLSRAHLEDFCRQLFHIKHGKTQYTKVFTYQGVKVKRCYNDFNDLIIEFIDVS